MKKETEKMLNKYVPYNVAMKLYVLDFDWPCSVFYDITKKTLHVMDQNHGASLLSMNYVSNVDSERIPSVIAAPTISDVVDWFNEVHKIDISAHVSTSGKYAYDFSYWLGDSDGWKRDTGSYGYETKKEAYLKAFEKAFTSLDADVNPPEGPGN